MLHEDLQPVDVYWQQIFSKYLFRYGWSTRLAHRILGARLPHNGGASNPAVHVEERYLPTNDGDTKIRVKIYRPSLFSGKLPPMLYTHGGGYITGAPEFFEGMLAKFMERRPCIIVAPAYRNALIKPYPAALDDCYMTLLWMRDNADELGIDARKFMIAGHSAGGGLTAAVTLKARDTKDVNVAFQMPYYPMIDDQQPKDPARDMDSPGWDTRTNAFGWACYLKDLHVQGVEIPAYAAPARNTDYSGFPPTITFVGEYEPFYWETVEYARRLQEAGVDVVFKEYEKCTHGPDMIIPDSPLGQDAIAFSLDNYADFYDRYIGEEDARPC
jgi:acetyl esterase/lipase